MTAQRPYRVLFFLSMTLVLCGLLLHAQEPERERPAKTESSAAEAREKAEKPARRKAGDDDDRPARVRRGVRPSATPGAAATPKPGFFKRVFGKKPVATPTPAATPKPRPKGRDDEDEDEPVKKKAAAAEKKSDGDEPDAVAKKAGATPTPKGKRSTAKEPAKGADGELSKEQRALAEAVKGGDPETIEKAKYAHALARATEDEQIRELKNKAGAAASEEDGRKALRAYNRALFDRMRKVEPSITERIDTMEKAVLQRLGGGEE